MKDYRIIIKSTVDGETNQVITFGEVVKEYGATSVNYVDEESLNPTRIVISSDIVSIIKEGEISTVLTFEKDKTTTSYLSTMYGDIPMSLKTTDIVSTESEHCVNLDLVYLTDMGGEISRFHVSVKAERIAR